MNDSVHKEENVWENHSTKMKLLSCFDDHVIIIFLICSVAIVVSNYALWLDEFWEKEQMIYTHTYKACHLHRQLVKVTSLCS